MIRALCRLWAASIDDDASYSLVDERIDVRRSIVTSLKNSHALAIIGAFVFFLAIVTSCGPFISEDLQKIKLNSVFLTEGSIKSKIFQFESGIETGYFRPANNLTLLTLARIYGAKKAGPFRFFSALMFGLAVYSVYLFARILNLSPFKALAASLFFAAHPFGSWFYIQGAWATNALELPAMLATALFYRWILTRSETEFLFWIPLAGIAVYLAACCKDSALLIVPALFPFIFYSGKEDIPRSFVLWLSCVMGGIFFLIQRHTALGAEESFHLRNFLHFLSHGAWIVKQYLANILSGSNFIFAKKLQIGPGWPLTLASFLVFCSIMIGARKKPKILLLLWCILIASLELVIGSSLSFEIVPTRSQFLLAVSIILIMVIFSEISLMRPALKKPVLVFFGLLFLWYGSSSAHHLWTSLNEDRFYNYHNRVPYSRWLLFAEGLSAYERSAWPRAEKLFRESAEIMDRAPTRNNLGLALARQTNYKAAISEFVRALQLDPYYVPAARNLGLALVKSAQRKEGLDFEKLLKPLPDVPMIHRVLRRVFAENGIDVNVKLPPHPKSALKS